MAAAELALVPQTESALATIEGMTPEKLFAPGTIDAILDAIEAEVRSTYTDISTDKNRKAVASLGNKVSQSKQYIEDQRVLLVGGRKKELALIDADGKKSRDRLGALRDEVLQPLVEWRNAEKDRIAGHEAALVAIAGTIAFGSAEPTLRDIDDRLELVDVLSCRDWKEFAKRADEVANAACESLCAMRAATVKRNEERAELERLRLAEEERIKREREEAIANAAREKAEELAKAREAEIREAAERERLRLADESAEREAAILREKEAAEERARQAEAERIASEERAAREAKEAAEKAETDRLAAEQRAEDERLAAEARVRRAEEDRKAAIEQAERERIAAQTKANRDAAESEAERVAALERAAEYAKKVEADRIAAAEKARADQEAAVEAERQRAAVENKRIAEEEKAREKDRKLRADVHSVALDHFVKAGLAEDAAKLAVIAIAKGKIPNVKFSY